MAVLGYANEEEEEEEEGCLAALEVLEDLDLDSFCNERSELHEE